LKILTKPRLFLLSILILGISCRTLPTYIPGSNPEFSSFDDFYKLKLTQSKEKNVRPGNEEKLIRKSPGKTPIAILYIHGFSASRAEGEEVVDKLADTFSANTYYLRHPGHGTTPEDHRDRVFYDYLEEGRIALKMTKLLGDKVIVIGTSMGGLVATYLAAEYPEDVTGLILASPFYDFNDKTSRILNLYGGMGFTHLLFGKKRDVSYEKWKPEMKQLSSPDYDNYWTTKQYYEALLPLNDLRRAVSNEDTFSKVMAPTLMMYYYKNDKEKDKTASVDKMLNAYQLFASTKQSGSINKLVKIENGAHVLLSKYIKIDKKIATIEMEGFIKNFIPKK
jgi:pimeloyl-ACP methyl ester carboxylesterase